MCGRVFTFVSLQNHFTSLPKSLALAAKLLQHTSTGHVTLQKYVRGPETEKEKRSNTVTTLGLQKPGYQAYCVLVGPRVSVPVVCHWIHTYTGAVVSTNNGRVRVYLYGRNEKGEIEHSHAHVRTHRIRVNNCRRQVGYAILPL